MWVLNDVQLNVLFRNFLETTAGKHEKSQRDSSLSNRDTIPATSEQAATEERARLLLSVAMNQDTVKYI
jgi:hypothetical protein